MAPGVSQDPALGGPRSCGQWPSGALGLDPHFSVPFPPGRPPPPPRVPPSPGCPAAVWDSLSVFTSQSNTLRASTLGTLGGFAGSPSCRAQSGDVASRRPGPSAPQNPGRASSGWPVLPSPAPYQPVAESGEKGWGSLWTGRLRHCPPGSPPHVIVTFDLAQKPIGRGLGGRARGAGGKGLCPCRPLTKYRNSRGGGPRRHGWADACGEGEGSVSFYFYPPPPQRAHS